MAAAADTYSVIGVRADRSQHIMAMRISHDDAKYLQDVLFKARIFANVLIESDESQAGKEAQEAAGREFQFTQKKQEADQPARSQDLRAEA